MIWFYLVFGEGRNRLCLPVDSNAFFTHPTYEWWTTPPVSMSSTLFAKHCGFFHVTRESDHWKCCETRVRFFHLNSRRLKCLTSICRCQREDSTFFPLISTPWALVRPEIESGPTASKSGTQPVDLTKLNYFEIDIPWSVIPSYFRDSILQQRRVKTPKMKRLKTSKKK